MTRWASIVIAGSMCVAGGNLRATEVGLIKINGAIGPATAGYISRAIDVAAARQDACLIIQLDTPGGLLDSTKDIVQKFYASPVPTVVYVSPSGASARQPQTSKHGEARGVSVPMPVRTGCERASAGVALRQCLQQRLGLLEVRGVKALGEPAVDRCQQRMGFGALALLLPQATQAHGRP